jgi:hypothetical protein
MNKLEKGSEYEITAIMLFPTPTPSCNVIEVSTSKYTVTEMINPLTSVYQLVSEWGTVTERTVFVFDPKYFKSISKSLCGCSFYVPEEHKQEFIKLVYDLLKSNKMDLIKSVTEQLNAVKNNYKEFCKKNPEELSIYDL